MVDYGEVEQALALPKVFPNSVPQSLHDCSEAAGFPALAGEAPRSRPRFPLIVQGSPQLPQACGRPARSVDQKLGPVAVPCLPRIWILVLVVPAIGLLLFQ